MRIEPFELERIQSIWENRVEINLAESGVHPVSLAELRAMGLDLDALERRPLGYIQTNGSVELREAIARMYPGAAAENVLVTNGGSEANFILTSLLIEPGDEAVFQVPNYMQFAGLARAFGATVRTFELKWENAWAPDLDAFERALNNKTRLVYVSHPNNPTGATLAPEAMERIARAVERAGAWLIADEIYRGAELAGPIAPSFWGMTDRALVTSGLSKAYGIPGARIGWIVGPPELVEKCWGWKDYTSIAPGTLSDAIARVAVSEAGRAALFARGRRLIGENRKLFADWVARFNGRLNYREPRAGAIAFVSYNNSIGSAEFAHRLRERRSVLVAPGAYLGMEGFLRFNIGAETKTLVEGLKRVESELEALD